MLQVLWMEDLKVAYILHRGFLRLRPRLGQSDADLYTHSAINDGGYGLLQTGRELIKSCD